MRITASSILLLLTLQACSGPLGPFAGGRLSGEPVSSVPTDWSFTAEVMMVQLETRPGAPYSVNLGVVEHDGSIYVGSEHPQDSRWVANLLEDPRVRLRIEGRVYELRAERVTDPDEWALAGRKFFDKYELELEPGHEPGWMIRLAPR